VNFARLGAFLAFLGVALGAFGAHALKARLAPEDLGTWHTAVLYHLIHALALFALGLYAPARDPGMKGPGALFALGILLFSGSLYALALTGVKPLGAITPLGGMCFLAGWAWLALKNYS
jgi:uncharacterized membrane protein YgdD (TMEM256/DUF423 family)